MDPVQVGVGIAVMALGVNIFGWFFLHTGRFQSEFESKNKIVEAILFNEFHKKLEDLRTKETESKLEGKGIESLYQDDKALVEKFEELSRWKEHIGSGKTYIQNFALWTLCTTILFGLTVIIYKPTIMATGSDFTVDLVVLLIYLGMIALVFSIINLWKYCALSRRIEKKVSEL